MTIIKKMAFFTAKNIRDKQNFFTKTNRKTVIHQFELALCHPDITDENIIKMAKKMRDEVINSKEFGARGIEGSGFLKEINTFIHLAEFLLSEKELVEKKTVSYLQLIAMEVCSELINSIPDENTRKNTIQIKAALIPFIETLKLTKVSDEEIITSAKNAIKHFNANKGQTNFWNKDGLQFLETLLKFVKIAEQLTKINVWINPVLRHS